MLESSRPHGSKTNQFAYLSNLCDLSAKTDLFEFSRKYTKLVMLSFFITYVVKSKIISVKKYLKKSQPYQ